ncbi:MAG: hypothetical protein DMG06_13190 [Acidobacteria bacterium]|nr:MAG: hypothetical protein DMG06_13190 [Acidobacteriota bacterium]
MYSLLVVCLALAVLLASNLMASGLVAALWHGISGWTLGWSATARSRLLFTLRIFPVAATLVGVVVLFIPSYILYEPRPADEVLDTKLVVIAACSAAGIVIAFWRSLLSWRATKRLMADWMRHAVAVRVDGLSVQAYCLLHPFPVIAVVGTLRPQLFVSKQIFDSLDRSEILAAMEHEIGHLSARDNLKRVLIRGCRDLLAMAPWGRSLDRDWSKAAEAAADEYAAARGSSTALDLASALVKIARMIPEKPKLKLPVGAPLLGDDPGGLAWRVRRLTQIAEAGCGKHQQGEFISKAVRQSCLYISLAVLTCAALIPHFLVKVHALMEHLFPFLD